MKINKNKRIGEVNYNTYGNKMTIIKYNTFKDIIIKFKDGSTKRTNYDAFKKGQVLSLYDRTVYGVGFVGEGKYKKNIEKDKYHKWTGMIARCYKKIHEKREKNYKNCTVCDEWHNYQNFAKWYDENYYEIGNEKMCLDKDILHKNNKIYSPKNCIFVPDKINLLFTKSNAIRGNLPIGTCFAKDTNRYQSNCKYNGASIYLGQYNTPEKAFYVYKNYKENLIKQIADSYKEKIPQKLYNAMYRYEVEITD